MGYERREIPPQEIERQRQFAAKTAALTSSGPTRLAFVDTYGCQQNEADSEKIRGMLGEMGYAFTKSEAEADVIVINTCAVREHAEMRILGNVGALSHTKKAKPEQLIVLCGCMMQEKGMAEKIKRSYPYVGLVFGTHDLWRFPELLYTALTRKKRLFSVSDTDGAVFEGLPTRRDGGVKAWLSIMNGCNNFCSYCIVPYVRGRERSRLPEHILADAELLLRDGVKDITLLGQNVNSYGRGLSEAIDFPDLIRRVGELPGDFLIRFMTSHPKDAGEKLFRAMAECPKAAHQLHLPFQSGSDRILKEMNRGYTREKYLSLVSLARSYMPDIVITSDVIVGFPGETEADFEDTLRLAEEARFDALFTFIYSKRTGTPAAVMPDPVTRAEKQARFDRLLKLQDAISSEKQAAYVGRTMRVLVDGLSGREEYPLTSRTNGGRLVHLKGDAGLVGSFAEAEITGSNTWALYGKTP
ncbi:MAG: tRNA (N6-isopentenyl adenosine(37)-C2)-methylthiotransferase MiaB [Oscillospiraceae bacterium]|nr:tRNA (N6-isopentenyl adenosine(37)-C2)-methylthiotransferase MiaB [Oscillospiraceae bacterium]